ncbi:glutamate--cysteine ligase [Streptomyces sp. NPDC048295]|uniref:carboxylate-amine ligase n=1 Tax=Streptomyces sp. NPDC048295 TaxID=3154617 RepID=UPI0034197E16
MRWAQMEQTGTQQPPLGVEEEFFLVDPETGAAAAAGERVVARAVALLGDLVAGELSEYQVEVRTPPCRSLAQLTWHLDRARRCIAAAAAAEGLGVVASGTPLLGARTPVPLRADPRYRDGIEEFRALNDSFASCALHVHVQVPDREEAVYVSNHLRPWLPTLVAMAANSPFWDERDSGYASWRTLAASRWPVAGPPPYFSSFQHFVTLTEALQKSGATLGERTLYWDVRPCAHLPTVEIRAMDVTADVEEAAALAVLVRAMVVQALERVRRGDPGPPVSEALMRAAYWRSARDGWPGHGLSPCNGLLVSTRQMARELLAYAGPALAEHGELRSVVAVLRRTAAEGGGAGRQRAAHRHRAKLQDVVTHLAEHTIRPAKHAATKKARIRTDRSWIARHAAK